MIKLSDIVGFAIASIIVTLITHNLFKPADSDHGSQKVYYVLKSAGHIYVTTPRDKEPVHAKNCPKCMEEQK